MITFILRIVFAGLLVGLVWWWLFVAPEKDIHQGGVPQKKESRETATILQEVITSSDVIDDGMSAPQSGKEGHVVSEVSSADTKKGGVISPKEVERQRKVLYDVPFVSQAPLAQWEDKRFQDACEEASILMANLWIKNQRTPRKKSTSESLIKIFDAEKIFFPSDPLDTSTKDIARFTLAHFDLSVEYKEDISMEEIIDALAGESVVIVPTNGKALKNPYFSNGGPDRHMLLIRGYDLDQNVFITNDPGTKRGERYAYDMHVLYGAIRDYKTGYHEPFDEEVQKNAIIISR